MRHPNVYADTSGVRRFSYLVQAVRRAGPWKLLFGSDGPWLHPGLELFKIRLLGLAPEAQALVLGGNAYRLVGKARSPSRALRVPAGTLGTRGHSQVRVRPSLPIDWPRPAEAEL